MTIWEACVLLAAGVGGGLTGSIAGLASLVSYPALLAVGLTPIAANVTNTVALVSAGAGSITASGPELKGQWNRLRQLALAGLGGGIIGAMLLLLTPSGSFKLVVPWLIAIASVLVLSSHRIVSAEGERYRHPGIPPLTTVGTFVTAIYGGYFGAAAGVVMLVLLQVTLTDDFPRLNAIKNLVAVTFNLVAAVIFAFVSPVHWVVAAPLAVGFFMGGRIGPAVTRAAPAAVLRLVICLMGLGLAVWLGIDAYG